MTDCRPVVEIYTDGACEPNPGFGGWAYLLIHPGSGKEKLVSGYERESTNNRMELLSVIYALEALKKPCVVWLFSDSQYVIKGLQTWMDDWIASKRLVKPGENTRGKAVKNPELFWRLDDLRKVHEIRAQWIRGHTGHPIHDRVDQAAVDEIQRNNKTGIGKRPPEDF